ncbi:hypothetical protein N341_12457, partial [Tyto alba]
AALVVKDMVSRIPVKDKDKPQFAFTWEGTQYTFNRLPQGYKGSTTIAHNALAKLLDTVEVSGIHIYQYVDDILVSGNTKEVGKKAETSWDLLTKNELDIFPSKYQGTWQEIKFLRAWWVARAIVVPDDTLLSTEKGKIPGSKTELQQVLDTLGYRIKPIPGFLAIAHALYDLLQKNREWDLTPQHTEVPNILKDELKTYQSLGPLHTQDP